MIVHVGYGEKLFWTQPDDFYREELNEAIFKCLNKYTSLCSDAGTVQRVCFLWGVCSAATPILLALMMFKISLVCRPGLQHTPL